MKKRSMTFFLLLPFFLMAQSNKPVTENFLQSFADAFNAHDTRAIMSHMTEDCVFEASAGPDVNGEVFRGQEQVKHAFENVFATFPDAKWSTLNTSLLETGALPNGFLLEPKKMAPRLR